MRHFPEQVREASNNLARFPHIPEAKSFRWSDYTRGMGGAIASSLKGEHLPSGTTGYLTGILKSLAGAARDAQTPGEMLYGSPVGTFGDNQWTRPDPYELNTKQELWGSYGGMAGGALAGRPTIRGRVPGVAGRGSGRTPPAARTPSPVDGEMAGGNRPIRNFSSMSADILKVGEYQYTRTAGNHAKEIVIRGEYKGELSRPYLTSLQTIKEIISTGKAIPDPGGVPGAIKYNASGRFRGASGTWELVLNPNEKIIYHFNFVRDK